MFLLQIRPTVHNQGAPRTIAKLHPGPCSSAGMRRRQYTDARDQYTFRVVYDSREM